MRSDNADQFVAVKYELYKLDGTNILPYTPPVEVVRPVIGVFENAFVVKVGIDEPSKYTDKRL